MRRLTGAALAAVAVVMLVGCGGGDGGSPTTKAGWEKDNGALVSAYSRDLDDALNNINQGARTNTVGSCTQVADDARDLNANAFPVPNPAVDAPLRKAVDTGIQAAADCITGSKGNARDVEKAMVEFADARKALNEAEAAIQAWQ